jgi:hypothetical protein
VLGVLVALGLAAGTTSPAMAQPPDVLGAEAVAVAQTQAADGASHPLQLRVLGRGSDATPLVAGSAASGYTPAQVRSNLGLTGTGAGQTIAVVTAYDAPNIVRDLAVFNTAFGLPAPPSFRKVNQSGGTRYPAVDPSWALEAALDVQWAHAVAPAANILLVEATTNSMSNLLSAVSWAAAQPGVSVVSGSFGIPEYLRQKDNDARCRLTTAVCVFASGDTGNPPAYPATGPWALGVGGTSLSLDAAGAVLARPRGAGPGRCQPLHAEARLAGRCDQRRAAHRPGRLLRRRPGDRLRRVQQHALPRAVGLVPDGRHQRRCAAVGRHPGRREPAPQGRRQARAVRRHLHRRDAAAHGGVLADGARGAVRRQHRQQRHVRRPGAAPASATTR